MSLSRKILSLELSEGSINVISEMFSIFFFIFNKSDFNIKLAFGIVFLCTCIVMYFFFHIVKDTPLYSEIKFFPHLKSDKIYK